MPEHSFRMIKPGLLTVVLFSLLLGRCGNEEPAKTEIDSDTTSLTTSSDTLSSIDPYADWLTYTYHNYKLRYADGHPHQDEMHTVITSMERVTPQTCNLLDIPVPTDTITIYFYTGFGQGREITGHEWPYIVGDTFHLWRPSYPQVPMVEYLLRKWQNYVPKFKFVQIGMMVLLDYSGVDYHEATLNLLDGGVLISLADLAVDTAINPYGERWQSVEAASFMAYLLDYYGTDGLLGLYRATGTFEKTTMGLFSKTPATLQEEWLHYADSLYEAKLKAANKPASGQ